MAHACNPSTLRGQGRNITWTQEFKTSLGKVGRPCHYKKIKKRAGRGAPVVPATWEAEEGGLLEHRGWRLQWAVIEPLHSGLDDRVKPYL